MWTIYCATCFKWLKRLGSALTGQETMIGSCCEDCLEKSRQMRRTAEEMLDRRLLRC